MCLPTITQAGRINATQCVRLIPANALRTAPQRKTEALITSIYATKFHATDIGFPKSIFAFLPASIICACFCLSLTRRYWLRSWLISMVILSASADAWRDRASEGLAAYAPGLAFEMSNVEFVYDLSLSSSPIRTQRVNLHCATK